MSIHESLNVRYIQSDLQVVLEDSPHDIIIDEKIADEVFEKACQEKPLFNGTLICVKKFDAKIITTYPVSFKEFLACHHLGYKNAHQPLAVSGWVRHQDKVLFGIRSNKVLFSPLQIELVPSGGIDDAAIENTSINYQYALVSEFEQETGLLSDVIESIKPQLIIYCKEKSLYDICMSIVLKPEADIYCDPYNDEYDQLFWVPINEIAAFVEENKLKMNSTSLAIIYAKILS